MAGIKKEITFVIYKIKNMDFTTIVVYHKDMITTILTLLMVMPPAFASNEITYTAEKPMHFLHRLFCYRKVVFI